ncbi:hypothetical protein HPP92_013393 [Vanilla planifolia]|uniref:Uncharacterized protein n=1 Tax=Vanilla planifolia TaxID=51239 RepID=A0A835UWP4_VANPL|nr:hypothetical protein HPP92_013823 [Vanilla planifolia]KAG0478674.1 hypothetical protein HPP92_013393 [Vanilla planifolia]
MAVERIFSCRKISSTRGCSQRARLRSFLPRLLRRGRRVSSLPVGVSPERRSTPWRHHTPSSPLPPLPFARLQIQEGLLLMKSPKNGLRMNTIRPPAGLRPPRRQGLHRRGRSSSSSISSNSRGGGSGHEEMSPTSTLCFEWNAGAGGRGEECAALVLWPW